MRTRLAAVGLAASTLVLVGTLIAWRARAAEAPRADLVDGATATAEAPPPTTAPPSTSPATVPPPSDAPPFTAAAASPPARLALPSLEVDVPVRAVGRLPDGSMEIPGTTEAGWYAPGPHPGAPSGSSVIAAHIDYGGQPGAFFRLRELQVGELVSVTEADGTVHGYVVTERLQVPKEQLPIDELFRRTGAPTLTLITCGGAFDTGERRYSDNIVVRAVPA